MELADTLNQRYHFYELNQDRKRKDIIKKS